MKCGDVVWGDRYLLFVSVFPGDILGVGTRLCIGMPLFL